MSLRKSAAFAALLWLVLAGAAFAQRAAPYTLLNPPQPTEPGKIEVIEFFWYACPHCYHLESAAATWAKSTPKDVVFRRVPAAAGSWATLATVFYTLESMGLLEQYHVKVFDAIHKEGLNLGNPSVRDEWLAKQGIDLAKYHAVEKSFAVMTKVQRAKQMTMSYKIDAVPQLVVDGRFVVSAESAGGQDRMFQAVDQAVATARREKTASTGTSPELVKR